mgnify:CR=1 FL=1
MTFPLGSLRAETGAPASSSASTTRVVPHWRARLLLGIGAVLWLLALIALVTHSATDPAFTTSGNVEQAANKAGALGALFSDALYFLFGFSAWWLMLVSLRAWLGGLARVLRSEHAPSAPSDPHEPPAWLFWVGIVVLLDHHQPCHQHCQGHQRCQPPPDSGRIGQHGRAIGLCHHHRGGGRLALHGPGTGNRLLTAKAQPFGDVVRNLLGSFIQVSGQAQRHPGFQGCQPVG